jgi:hypothetical protein
VAALDRGRVHVVALLVLVEVDYDGRDRRVAPPAGGVQALESVQDEVALLYADRFLHPPIADVGDQLGLLLWPHPRYARRQGVGTEALHRHLDDVRRRGRRCETIASVLDHPVGWNFPLICESHCRLLRLGPSELRGDVVARFKRGVREVVVRRRPITAVASLNRY